MSALHDDPHLRPAIETLAGLKVEQLRCYRIDRELRRVFNVSPEQLFQDWETQSDEVWIDIQAADPEGFREFLEKLDLHPLVIEDCLDPYRSSRFSSYETSLHFEFPVFATDSIDEYLSVVCVPRMLITIRTTRIDAVDELLRDFDGQLRLIEGTKAALLYCVLDTLGDALVHAARSARAEIRQMSHCLDSDQDDVDVEGIIKVKRKFQDIATVAEDQLYCVRALVAVETDALAIGSERDYLRDAVRNYETAMRVVHRYEARAGELHQQYLLSLQAKTEARIRTLTILSSICMPLTLIAGIYGMNFARMPELHSSFGYPVTLALMFVIACSQLVFFYSRGWFG